MKYDERAILKEAIGDWCGCASPAQRVWPEKESAGWSSESHGACAKEKIKRSFSQWTRVAGLHFENQLCFPSLAEEGCLVYTIRLRRIAD
jgi:hypothetical protein